METGRRAQSSGILVVDKPADMTSARVVARVKSALKAGKAGHTGTLDPFATGVMLCCVNQATRLARFFLHGSKRYNAVLHLGLETDTQDATGKVTAAREVPDLAETQIRKVFKSFEGSIEQAPPVYSALKHQGVPLYKLARKGRPVQKPPRQVVISALRILAIDLPYIRFEVACSSGTYIRTLSADIGTALKCGAHLKTLRRTESSGFSIDEAAPLAALESFSGKGAETWRLIPMAEALREMPEVAADKALADRIAHGVKLSRTEIGPPALPPGDGFLKVVDEKRRLLAVLEQEIGKDHWAYCCVFNQ